MFPESWAVCATSNGRVQPIRTVGITTRMKLIRPVWSAETPAVNRPAQWNKLSETKPKVPIPSSTSPKMASSGTRLVEMNPPNRLPRPRPSMKALTTMVTHSMLTP